MNNTGIPFLDKLERKHLIMIGVGVLALIIGIWFISKYNSTRNDMISKENELTAQYKDNQNVLSKFRAGFYEQIGVAEAKSEAMDQILTDAVKSRYVDPSGETVNPPTNGELFSAMVEAYPDLAGLDVYDEIVNYIQGGRADYASAQTKLLDMIRRYKTWKDQGLIHSRFTAMVGSPSERLVAVDQDGAPITGAAALAKMEDIVTLAEVQDIYASGEDQVLTIPERDETVPDQGTAE